MAFTVKIADATVLDPQSGRGANGNGWVAIIVLAGLTSLVGTIDATQLTLTVSDPGYDATGSATTVVRTIKGKQPLRRQWPNGNSLMISTNGTDLTIYVVLTDRVYGGSTVTAASITSSFYTGATSGSATTITNSSTRAYPKPLFAWVMEQQRSSGSTFDVEAVAFHRHARNGRQVACIEFAATDGTTTTSSVFASSTQLSANVKQGNPPEVFAGTLNVSGLTNGTVCTVNAKAYPWVGDSTAILDLSSSGTAWPTTLPQTKMRFLCDRTGAYGGAYAYVKVGASGGTVSATALTARAAPFPTILAAITAIQTWNNTNKSHNDAGGSFIRLMDTNGAPAAHGVDGTTSITAGLTWCTIEPDPMNRAQLTIYGNGLSQMPSLMRWRGNMLVDSAASGGNWIFVGQDAGRDMLCLDGLRIDNSANMQMMIWYGSYYLLNLTLVVGDIDMSSNSSALTSVALGAGIVSSDASVWTDFSQKVMIGCRLPGYTVTQEGKTTADGDEGRIIYNNHLQGAFVEYTSAKTLSVGWANVQNVYQRVATGGAICMNYFADNDLTTIDNYIDMHNTAIGERCSRMYNDAASHGIGTYGVEKYGISKYNITDNWNCKTDTFNGGTGATGNWEYINNVGNEGNVNLFGGANRSASDAPHNDNNDSPYLGPGWMTSSEYNLSRTYSQAQIMAMFQTYTVQPQTSSTIGGNYVPRLTAAAIAAFGSRVPAGMGVLKYDLAGRLRATDGTGAAGAYEMPPARSMRAFRQVNSRAV